MRAALLALMPLLLGAASGDGEKAETSGAKGAVTRPASKVDPLRKACYGGRGKARPELVLQHWRQNGMEAVARQEHERAVHWFRKGLRGGDDEKLLLPVFLLSGEKTNPPLGEEAVEACSELLRRLGLQGNEGSSTLGGR